MCVVILFPFLRPFLLLFNVYYSAFVYLSGNEEAVKINYFCENYMRADLWYAKLSRYFGPSPESSNFRIHVLVN